MARIDIWGGSLHQTFRLLPDASRSLRVFLSSDGASAEEVLARLPYDSARAGPDAGTSPDAKRYRDGRHVYQTVGLLFEDTDGHLRVTELGKATHRWIGKISHVNGAVLGRHAAYALAACQLRNPTRAGQIYADNVEVFPFAFIWRAMLALGGKINSDELNRAVFRIANARMLDETIDRITRYRRDGEDVTKLGQETISGKAKNDRIIPWMALASFGWLLIADKRETGGSWYQIRTGTRELLREAAQINRKHRSFASVEDYVRHISDAACLPMDVR